MSSPAWSDLEREVMEVVWKVEDEISVRRVAELVKLTAAAGSALTPPS